METPIETTIEPLAETHGKIHHTHVISAAGAHPSGCLIVRQHEELVVRAAVPRLMSFVGVFAGERPRFSP